MQDQVHETKRSSRPVEEHVDLRIILPLCVAALLGAANVLGPAPFFSDQASDLNSSVPIVGQAVTVALLTAAVAGIVAGPLADHIGHRRLLLVGVAAIGLSALGTALAPGLYTFMGSRLLAGIGSSIGIGVSFGAAVSTFAGRARRRSISMISAGLSLATALGPLCLTTVAAAGGWRGAFILLAALATVALAVMWSIFPVEPAADGRVRFSLRQVLASYLPIAGDPSALRLYAGWALRSVCWIGCYSFLGAFFIEEHGYSTQAVGVVYLIAGSGYFVGTMLAGGRLGSFNLTTLSAGSLATMGLGWLLIFAVLPGPAMSLPVLILTAVASGVAGVSVVTLIAERTSAGPATSMVLTETVLSVGAAIGGATGGLLLGLGGYAALGVVVPLAGIAGAWFVFRQPATASPDEPPRGLDWQSPP